MNAGFSHICGVSSSRPALCSSALSISSLSITAEHGHQVDCQDAQTTGMAILIVLCKTAEEARLKVR